MPRRPCYAYIVVDRNNDIVAGKLFVPAFLKRADAVRYIRADRRKGRKGDKPQLIEFVAADRKRDA